jgi:thymidine kinase
VSYFYAGGIEVVCGPMFSGKTEALISRVKRAIIARQKVQIFKPAIDDRYDAEDVVSHSSLKVKAHPVSSSVEILQKVYDSTRVVAIDEVQFFDEDVVRVATKLARRGIRVICSGLDQDSNGKPFGPMPQLLCIADRVDKVQAVCTVCGAPATKSYRLPTSSSDQVLVGEADIYQARCRQHFDYYNEEEEVMHYTVTHNPQVEPQVTM